MNPFSGLMNNFGKMQEKMQGITEELKNLEVNGKAALGMAEVKIKGHDKVEVLLSDDLLQQPKEVIEEVVASAILDMLRNTASAKNSKMQEMMQQMGLPAAMNFPLQFFT